MTTTRVLVTGATGQQGGSVVDALLERGMRVSALVRNPQRARAQALAAKGVELSVGDLTDGASIAAAARGQDAVWVNTTPFAPGVGIEGEIAQGRTIVQALAEVRVPHVVYSSVSDADRATGIPHFDSKWDAEQHLRSSGLPVTVTAPVFFADNFIAPWNVATLKEGKLRHAMPPDRRLQIVSVRDIGRFNAAVIARGPSLAGRRFNYAGDELTSRDIAQVIARHSGREIAYEQQPIAEVRAAMPETAAMFEWFASDGYTADIRALTDAFAEVEWQSFDAWASNIDWKELMQ